MKTISQEEAEALYETEVPRVLATSNELNDFATAWTGNDTGFTLQQLAALVVPHERERSRAVAERGGILGVACTFAGVGLGGSIAAFMFMHGLEALILGLFMMLLPVFLFIVTDTEKRFGRFVACQDKESVYMAEIDRFTLALERAVFYLRLDLGRLISGGHKTAARFASERLDAEAMEIAKLERMRSPEADKIEVLEREAQIRACRNTFQEHYDTFASLKLERRKYGAIFAAAQSKLDGRKAA